MLRPSMTYFCFEIAHHFEIMELCLTYFYVVCVIVARKFWIRFASRICQRGQNDDELPLLFVYVVHCFVSCLWLFLNVCFKVEQLSCEEFFILIDIVKQTTIIEMVLE